MSKKPLFRLAVLVTAMMCALGASAQEAYACAEFDTQGNATLTFYYDNDRSSHSGITYVLNAGEDWPRWIEYGYYVKHVVFAPSFAAARPTSTSLWFGGMSNLESITGLSYLNTSEVTNMEGMFEDCTSLHTICVGSGWSTDAVYASEDMGINDSRDMFYNCKLLVGGKGTPYDFSYVDKTYAHIDGRPSNPGYLTDVNEPVAYACYTPENTTLTFYYDKQRLTREGTTYSMNVDYNDPRWYTDDITPNVTQVVFDPSFANARPTTTDSWFAGMANLKTIRGLSYLNTSQVTNMRSMFGGCTALTSLDLSSFNTSQVTNMSTMFIKCSNLHTIYVSDGWSTAAVSNDFWMFMDCNSLVGGQGTTYDANHVDATYAHIDGGTDNPGYFTEKNTHLCGDVNGDLEVNIADVNAVIDIIKGGNDDTSLADVNGDGEINIADINAIINIILNGNMN